jgi:DNA-binding transcriptional ArsR family regulator
MVPETLSVDSKKGTSESKNGLLSTRQSLFGSPGRTDILVLVAGMGRSFPRELSRLTKLPLTTIVRGLDDFERAGVLVSARLGGTREVRLNPEYVAAKELATLLEALVEREPRYREIISGAARRRPRRSGKPV